MNYCHIQPEPGLWTVGFYKPDGKFEPESDHPTSDEATARVHYLNGGDRQALTDVKHTGRTREERCPDCGERGEIRGHMTCQYPMVAGGEE